MLYHKIYILITAALLLFPAIGRTATLAVFPVEDLSQGNNGVNFEFSEFISQTLADKGLDIVPMDQLVSFMAKKRIRRLGFLDSATMHKLLVDLGAEYIVFATISQLKEDKDISLGLIIQILRTSDGSLIWSKAQALSCSDTRRILAVDEPQSVYELRTFLADDLFAGFSFDHIPHTDHKQGEVIIEEVKITPRHARPGTEMTCTIKITRKNDPDSQISCLLAVGGNDYYKMGPYLKSGLITSWVASEKEGSKPVSLIIGSNSDKKITYLGSYDVDNTPPELDILLKGVKIGKNISFSTTLPIIPIWQKKEQLSKWQISIIKKGGKTVLINEGTGDLPPRFDWKGQRKDGHKTEQGTYLVRLLVWDLASNQTSVTHEVEYHRDTPQPKIQASVVGDKLVVKLDYQGAIPLKWWSTRILFSDGETLVEEQGDMIPAEIMLPVADQDEKRTMECLVEYHDVLGNRGRKKITDLRQLLIGELLDAQEEIIEDEWLETF